MRVVGSDRDGCWATVGCGIRCGDGCLELGLRLHPQAVLALAEVLDAIGCRMLRRVMRLESHWLLLL